MELIVARARNIKPGFFTNDALAEIEPLGRLLFAGLWCIADREGRLEDRPKKIKAQTLPYDDCDIDSLLSALCSRGFVLRYKSGENYYIQIVNWHKHQNPHVKEQASTIPAPDKSCYSNGVAPDFPELAGLIPDSLNLIPGNTTVPQAGPPEVDVVFKHWQKTLNHPQAKLTPERERKIKIALKTYSAPQLCKAIEGCSKTPHNMGQNDRHEVYDDISLILRDAAHIERFMRNADSPPKPAKVNGFGGKADIDTLAKSFGLSPKAGESQQQWEQRVMRENERRKRELPAL